MVVFEDDTYRGKRVVLVVTLKAHVPGSAGNRIENVTLCQSIGMRLGKVSQGPPYSHHKLYDPKKTYGLEDPANQDLRNYSIGPGLLEDRNLPGPRLLGAARSLVYQGCMKTSPYGQGELHESQVGPKPSGNHGGNYLD